MKFSKKRFDKRLERNIDSITRGYIEHGGKKDKRSKNITKADRKRAADAYERDVKGRMQANPGMTTGEAMERVQRSNRFNEYATISKQNMRETLKQFGVNVQMRSLQWDKGADMFLITRGQYAGKYVHIVHNPGSFPSYTIELI